jgi:hypothetical protein
MSNLAADIVNLHSILNGDPFLVPIRLRKNGETIQIKALMNTGAQVWLLGDQKLCELLVKR